MPITIDKFVESDELGSASTSELILRFLLENDEQAYTRREIADAIDAKPETVGTNLTRLKDRGLVRHRAPYWALTDDRERAITAVSDRGDADEERRSTTRVRPHREAAATFAARVRKQLESAVDELFLFGSVARDAETETSDVDVLVVLADGANVEAADDRLLDVAYDVQLEHGVPIEVHTLRASEFDARRKGGDPFVRTVVEEGESVA